MKIHHLVAVALNPLLLIGCLSGAGSSGQHYGANSDPFFVTTQPLIVKNVSLPAGTKLTYWLPSGSYNHGKHKSGAQEKMLNDEFLNGFDLPAGQTMIWGGVPIVSIQNFFNDEKRGFSVTPEMTKLPVADRGKFAQVWLSCDKYIGSPRHAVLGILVKDINDWSFNPNNVSDVNSCTVNYQRYFKDDAKQQKFLDDLFAALIDTKSK